MSVFKSPVKHGTEYPRTRRITIGACLSALVRNRSLKAFQLPSGVSWSSMIPRGCDLALHGQSGIMFIISRFNDFW